MYLAQLGAAGGFAREFALKVIHPHLTDDPNFRARFFEEARLAARVRHPNAVRTVDAGEDHGYRYQVLELIDGVNLRQLMLFRGQAFSPTHAAVIAVQVARGLSALHTATDAEGTRLDMVHRDISPHNVMIDREGRAILIDLGLAKSEAKELTQVGVMIGKLPYMSPEQARLEPVGAASDLFSLGTVIYELCTDELPFGDDHSTSTFEALQRVDLGPIGLKLKQHGVPRWLAEIVLVCLQPDPSQRFKSAADVADALTQELSHRNVDESLIRAEMADFVAHAMPEIGTTEAYESGHRLQRRLLPAMEPSWRRAARWGFASAAVVLALAGGVTTLSRLYGTAERGPSEINTNLASDQPPELKSSSSLIVPARDAARPRQVTPSAVVNAEPDIEIDETADTAEEPAPSPPRRYRRARRTNRGLKPNPYAKP